MYHHFVCWRRLLIHCTTSTTLIMHYTTIIIMLYYLIVFFFFIIIILFRTAYHHCRRRLSTRAATLARDGVKLYPKAQIGNHCRLISYSYDFVYRRRVLLVPEENTSRKNLCCPLTFFFLKTMPVTDYQKVRSVGRFLRYRLPCSAFVGEEELLHESYKTNKHTKERTRCRRHEVSLCNVCHTQT